MQLFYLNQKTDKIILNKEESRHIIRVLRKKEGDIIFFTNGEGIQYNAQIKIADSKKCELNIIEKLDKKKQHKYKLHIAIAPTKNIDRFEWFLEKSTEIGIDEITPIICDFSEKKTIKYDRCKKIIISAMKQSLKYHLPKINHPISFTDLINHNNSYEKYIAHCQKTNKIDLKNILSNKKYLIAIGPEGDFSSKEIDQAINKKFSPISLGNSRLRTETAGLVATNTINLINS